MDFSLTDQQRAFKERFERICREHIAPHARDADRTGSLPQHTWRTLSEAGYFQLFHPEELGGSAADGVTLGIAMEALGQACASTLWSATISTGLCGKLLWNQCRPTHHRQWLAPILRGEKIGCVAGNERNAGSDQRSFLTKVRRVGPGRYLINGEKLRISNGPIADVAVVFAQLEESEGLSFAVVDLHHPGVKRSSIEHLGLRAMPWGTLTFEDVELSEEDVIQGSSPDKILRSIEWGLLFQCFCSIGLASAALEAGIDYAQTRRAFGRPIAHLQTVHSRLADMHVEIDAARLLSLEAASMMARGEVAGELVMMAKIHASEMAVRAADAAMRIFAGWGYSTDFVVERLYRDSLGHISGGQTTDRLRELVISPDVHVNPWEYEPFDWLSPAGLSVP